MATNRWKGGALAVAQVQTYTFGGTWEADDYVKLVIGDKTVYVVAGSVTTNTVVDNVVTAFNALSTTSYPEFSRITALRSSSNLVLTADDPGIPFTCTITPLEANLGAADAQTIEGAGTATTGTAATANSGPSCWDTAANWSLGTVPVSTNDVFIQNSSVSILYGLSQSGVTLASLTIDASFTGTIGLPYANSGGYIEYRTRYLTISATTVKIGQGVGNGSGRIMLATGSNACSLYLFSTGQPAETGLPPVLVTGSHASNALYATKGSAGIALFAGETAQWPVIDVGFSSNVSGDVTLVTGSGCTLATVLMTGGRVTVNSAITTLTTYDGTITSLAGNITTWNAYGGTLKFWGAGTITTSTILKGATLDCSGDLRGKTLTTTTWYAGAKIVDPGKTLTVTNAVTIPNGTWSDVSADLGIGHTYTIG